MTIELTEKAKENLQRIAESRKKDSQFVKLEPGEKTTLHFDPEKIEPVDVEFERKKSIRYQYTVSDTKEPEKSKYFTVSKRNSALIDTYLAEGQSILKIHRIGAGKTPNMLLRLLNRFTNSFPPLFTGLKY